MTHPYESECAKRLHLEPPWERKNIDSSYYYELIGSEKGNYTCVEYLFYKLMGIIPFEDLIIPEPPTTENIADWLKKNGYIESGIIDCSEIIKENCDCGVVLASCGCGKEQMSNCAVIYRDKETKNIFHVAVFDIEFCDWGGKLSGAGPIIRFPNPYDYCRRLDKSEREKTEIIFFCKNNPSSNYVSDENIMRGREKKSPSRDDDLGKKWGWLNRLLFGMLIAAFIALLYYFFFF